MTMIRKLWLGIILSPDDVYKLQLSCIEELIDQLSSRVSFKHYQKTGWLKIGSLATSWSTPIKITTPLDCEVIFDTIHYIVAAFILS